VVIATRAACQGRPRFFERGQGVARMSTKKNRPHTDTPAPRPSRPPHPAEPADLAEGTETNSHRFDPAQSRSRDSVVPTELGVDRRLGLDRREIQARINGGTVEAGERGTGLERRRGPGRRRTDFTKSAEEGEMNREQFLFLMAIDAFKKSNAVMYPTWSDVLEVVRLLGYRKTMPSELNIRGAEDFREPADSLSGVRAKPGHPEERREAA